MSHKYLILAPLVVFVVTGCAVHTPAPVVDKSRQSEHAYVESDSACKANQSGEFCHVVAKGDTLYAISRLYGAKVVEIASRNGIQAPYIIKPGQRLIIRPTQVPSSATSTAGVQPKPANNRSNQRPATPSPKKANQTTSSSRQATSSSRSNRGGSQPSVASISVKPADLKSISSNPFPGWHWPVSYQPVSVGGSSSAWDYVLADGVDVVSAKSGKVIYAGAGLNKFKHLVIVDDGARYLLSYEFNSSHSIREGQQLNAGDLITRIARPTGLQIDDQDRYKQLHFEIWSNGKQLNPNTVIGSLVRN